MNNSHSQACTDQAKRSQYWKTLNVLQAELDQTENDYNKIKTAPLVLEVLVQTEGDDLESSFNGENAREHLNTSENGTDADTRTWYRLVLYSTLTNASFFLTFYVEHCNKIMLMKRISVMPFHRNTCTCAHSMEAIVPTAKKLWEFCYVNFLNSTMSQFLLWGVWLTTKCVIVQVTKNAPKVFGGRTL